MNDKVKWMNQALYLIKANLEDKPNWNEAMGGLNGEAYW
jgi:hypothetical protein